MANGLNYTPDPELLDAIRAMMGKEKLPEDGPGKKERDPGLKSNEDKNQRRKALNTNKRPGSRGGIGDITNAIEQADAALNPPAQGQVVVDPLATQATEAERMLNFGGGVNPIPTIPQGPQETPPTLKETETLDMGTLRQLQGMMPTSYPDEWQKQLLAERSNPMAQLAAQQNQLAALQGAPTPSMMQGLNWNAAARMLDFSGQDPSFSTSGYDRGKIDLNREAMQGYQTELQKWKLDQQAQAQRERTQALRESSILRALGRGGGRGRGGRGGRGGGGTSKLDAFVDIVKTLTGRASNKEAQRQATNRTQISAATQRAIHRQSQNTQRLIKNADISDKDRDVLRDKSRALNKALIDGRISEAEFKRKLKIINQHQTHPTPVSYTHLTLPTILLV